MNFFEGVGVGGAGGVAGDFLRVFALDFLHELINEEMRVFVGSPLGHAEEQLALNEYHLTGVFIPPAHVHPSEDVFSHFGANFAELIFQIFLFGQSDLLEGIFFQELNFDLIRCNLNDSGNPPGGLSVLW